MIRHSIKRAGGGVTLIELLVALSLSTALALVMMELLVSGAHRHRRLQARLASEHAAQRVLDQWERDLQAWVWAEDDRIWLATDGQADSGSSGLPDESWSSSAGFVKPPSAAGSRRLASAEQEPVERGWLRFGQRGVWFSLFVREPGRLDDGRQLAAPPVQVSYQLVRRGSAAGRYTYGLYRSTSDPEESFAAGYEALGAQAEREEERTTANDALLAHGVVDFGVRVLAPNDEGAWAVVFPQPDGDQPFTASRPGPWMIECVVRMLDQDAAQRLAVLEQRGGAGEDWWSWVDRHAQVHTRRVLLADRGP